MLSGQERTGSVIFRKHVCRSNRQRSTSEVTLLARYHDVPNGTGITILETDDQEAMTAWTLGWATMCHFPIIKPMLDYDAARTLIKKMGVVAE